jgi:hypothetical protein
MKAISKVFQALVLVLGLSVSGVSLASSPADVPDLEVEIPGDYEIDVREASAAEVILSHKTVAGAKRPAISVVDQYGGFECELSTAVHGLGGGVEEILVYVSWMPGADSSGCVVELRDVDTNESALVELYMSY